MGGVTPIRPHDPGLDRALKRQALQIVAQLPEDDKEAIRVLDYAKTLVRTFLGEPEAS